MSTAKWQPYMETHQPEPGAHVVVYGETNHRLGQSYCCAYRAVHWSQPDLKMDDDGIYFTDSYGDRPDAKYRPVSWLEIGYAGGEHDA